MHKGMIKRAKPATTATGVTNATTFGFLLFGFFGVGCLALRGAAPPPPPEPRVLPVSEPRVPPVIPLLVGGESWLLSGGEPVGELVLGPVFGEFD
ncbi:hypothetical protein HanRHA438_Chr14g0648981 [Helianthus annuus]|uniref:Uncharacterized protein n=1 Tax=Helianthus annuus TaxID=4232 RepID=A0A9K3E9W1_HELAN|nr:hypothetical protein HanXRQr2_Chr14g0638471 [Helianthus annuus]KAJ0463830.1 hypothetical protein HanHA300_Chr14g0520001 [Helianthus annuus]KAJ0468118.1 hypothetical protein HanIR_Chr14g0692871 [Helianthus annuus]KAJ0485335.1 hypothetical protein HanHA89_Chr14g0567021 [Helianthus annuus]KAJ0655882.1 hypothetical protein HanLR1_Chr14g0529331 [Helianthus annuus]